MIHIVSPFSLTKDLGKAYNDAIRVLPENDWVCVMDYDSMFFFHDQIFRMYEYRDKYPDVTLFVCYGSRTHDLSPQRFGPDHENNTDFLHHYRIAKQQLEKGLNLKPIVRPVGGFLMLFSRKTWQRFKFAEGKMCLGIDTDFSRRIMRHAGKIMLMESIYVWHTYRIENGKKSKEHLL